MAGLIWIGAIGFAVLLSIIALIVASISSSQDSSTITVPQYMVRSTVAPQAITAATVTPLLFDTQITNSGGDSISYTSVGALFQVSRAGIYQVTANAAVNVSGTGGPVPSPISIWLHKGGSTLFYGLNQALPAQSTTSGTNSQYLTLNTTVSLVAGDTFSISVLAPLTQTILGGATTYMSIARLSTL